MAMCGLLIMMAGLWPTGGQAAETAPAAAEVTPVDPRIERLFDRLDHPRFEERDRATQQLCHLDPRHLSEIARRYHAEPRYEMKLRLRYIAEAVFHNMLMAGKSGFMGIRIAHSVEPQLTDPVTGRLVPGIIVDQVLAGFSAERAGIRSEDTIILFDGRPPPDDPTSEAFVSMVSSRPPGSVYSLRVLRPEPLARVVEVAVGAEPARAFDGAELRLAAPWIRVVSVSPASPAAALGLQANDTITHVNGLTVGATKGGDRLSSVLRSARAGDKLVLSVHGASAVELTITLMSRPAHMMTGAFAREAAEARRQFLQWWQEQGGEVLIPETKRPTVLMPTSVPAPLPGGKETSILP